MRLAPLEFAWMAPIAILQLADLRLADGAKRSQFGLGSRIGALDK